MLRLSQSPGFSAQWRLLAEKLGLRAGDIERVRDSGHDDEERCYQLLRKWDQGTEEATVVALSEVLSSIPNSVMLELLFNVVCPEV
jgi:hypothetical protein